jgi:hypothetical protein
MTIKIYEDCPICGIKLSPIQDNEDINFIQDYYCNTCGIAWNVDELEYVPEQRKLKEFF